MTSHSANDVLRTYNFFINSEQRSSGTTSNFVISLNQAITLNNQIPSEFHVYVDSAQIPFSFSQFNQSAKNTQCQWKLTRLGSITTGEFQIPFGNYTIYTLADAFIEGLRTSIEADTSPPYLPVINYVYDETNNRLKFTLSGLSTTTIEILEEDYTGLNRCLGFGGSWTLIGGDVIGISSTRDCDVSPSRCLYITSTTLQQAQNFSAISEPINLGTMLTMIPITVAPNIFIQHQPSYVVKTTLTNANITELQFSLRDNLLNEVYEMDLSWQMHLVIEEVRVEPFISGLYRQLGEFFMPQLSTEEQIRKQQLVDMDFRQRQEAELAQLRDKLYSNVAALEKRYAIHREKRKIAEKKNKISHKGKDDTNDQKTST